MSDRARFSKSPKPALGVGEKWYEVSIKFRSRPDEKLAFALQLFPRRVIDAMMVGDNDIASWSVKESR